MLRRQETLTWQPPFTHYAQKQLRTKLFASGSLALETDKGESDKCLARPAGNWFSTELLFSRRLPPRIWKLAINAKRARYSETVQSALSIAFLRTVRSGFDDAARRLFLSTRRA